MKALHGKKVDPIMKLTRAEKKNAVFGLLVQGVAPIQAAQSVGVPHSTVLAWLREPELADEIRRHRAMIVSRVEGELVDAGTEAARALLAIARDDAQLAKDRIVAANSVLDRIGLGVKSTLALTRAEPPPREVVDVSSLSDQELETISAASAIERRLLGGG